ncbi:hypothetical protein FHT40_000371 [Mycolicibacterium sp. BK556]|uniref:DUF4436 family protein n=1 Tax=unclassified Mycolicibacterium TaxID=2636767 RepID=UPI00161D7C1A|nr:hypothetical protein [Mycolicibacterium sp. BK556]MBB3630492.1 hypothetical protein [Mycolicibacterium sp. BK607]
MRRHIRRVRDIGLRRLTIAFLALAAVIGLSVTGYITSRNDTDQESYFGDPDTPDRVNVTAWITRVDSATQSLSVTIVDVSPNGKLADPEGNFAQDATLTTAAIGNWKADIKAGDAAPDIEQKVGVDGAVTDYPFDRYTGRFEVHVFNAEGNNVPVALTVVNTDPFFRLNTSSGSTQNGGVVVNLGLHRSMPTLIFAVFVMVLMLGLAIGAVVAAYYVLHWRHGLIFPACSMMAAILFALIPLRNAVPGSPPIGSIIDFGSFFIAEAVISISLISGIVIGFRHQRTKERAASEPEPEPDPIDSADEPVEQPS